MAAGIHDNTLSTDNSQLTPPTLPTAPSTTPFCSLEGNDITNKVAFIPNENDSQSSLYCPFATSVPPFKSPQP